MKHLTRKLHFGALSEQGCFLFIDLLPFFPVIAISILNIHSKILVYYYFNQILCQGCLQSCQESWRCFNTKLRSRFKYCCSYFWDSISCNIFMNIEFDKFRASVYLEIIFLFTYIPLKSSGNNKWNARIPSSKNFYAQNFHIIFLSFSNSF